MKKGEKRKQMLLETAYRMFISKGYEETSVDDIIAEAQIAKGTYYYYFKSKEQMLEEVIGMMIDAEAEKARQILSSDMPAPMKIVGIFSAVRPSAEEATIGDELNRPENLIMHNKINRRLIETMIPLLSEAVGQGVREGIFSCDHIPERVKMLLCMSSTIFDEGGFTDNDIEVFVDITEKILGAGKGSMDFIRQLIK